jgi:voltage-gated potassium channel Kch
VDRVLVGALLALFLLVFPSAAVFASALNLRYMDALYFVWTTVMTVGYGDIALKDAPDSIKIFGMALMLAGAGFIAVLFALLNDFVLSRRLDMLRGRTRVRGKGHALIVGAGNLGFRVAELLAPSVPHLVILERNPENRNIAALRAAGRHAIIADATNEEMLDLAGLDTAGVVLAVTDADSVNLQIALRARERGIPVIMRIVSEDLSAHVSARGEWVAFSPILTAAEAFAQAALAAAKA